MTHRVQHSASFPANRAPVWEAGVFRFSIPTAVGAAAWLMFLEFALDCSTRAQFADVYRFSFGFDLLRLGVMLVPVAVGVALGYVLGLRAVVYAFVAAVAYLAEQHRFQGLWTREGTLWAAGFSFRDGATALLGTMGGALCGTMLLLLVSSLCRTSATCATRLPPAAVVLGGLMCAAGGLWLSFLWVPPDMRALVGSARYSQGPFLFAFEGVTALLGVHPKLEARRSSPRQASLGNKQ